MKRQSLALLCGLGFFTPLLASAAFLSDIGGLPAEAAIRGLIDRGVIRGYDDGSFRPQKSINRAEFLKILIEARFPGRVPVDLRCFADLDTKTPQWYAASVCNARELGIVGGYPDGTFKPERTVNLAEALKMAMRAFGAVTPSLPGTPWYEPYVRAARDREILTSLLKNPSHLLTRAEMAELTFALVQEKEEQGDTPSGAICGNGVKESPEQCDDGNTADSDGCSSICISVPEPIRRSILQIDVKATGTVSVIAQGQKNVALFAFTATAGRQDAVLTSLTFEPSVGSLVYATNYTLLMDRTGDGNYETTVARGRATGGSLVFENLEVNGVVIPEDITVPFKITADLVSSLGPVSIGLQFASSGNDYVSAHGRDDGLELEGIETNGTCPPAGGCFIRVNTLASRDINVAERGNLWVTQDIVPSPSHILIGGSISPPLLRMRLRSDGEAVDIRELRFDGAPSNVDALSLYAFTPGETVNLDARTPFAVASSGQCTGLPATLLCAVLSLRTLLVDPAQDRILVVAAWMKSDTLGGVGGQTVTLSLAAATSDPDRSVIARGNSSLQELSGNDGDGTAEGEVFIGRSSPGANAAITGSTHDVAFASIASIVNDGASTSSTIPAGNATIGAWKISALPHTNSAQGSNNVVLKSITFQVTAQNVLIDPASYRLIAMNDPGIEHTCSAVGSTGTVTVTCSNLDTGDIQSNILQGAYLRMQLRANVTNTQVAPGTSSLVADIPVLGVRTQTNSISWSDEQTTFSWVDVPVSNVQSTVYQK